MSVAAFVFSLLGIILPCALVIAVRGLEHQGLFFIPLVFIVLFCGPMAIILGIVALATKRAKKGFAIAGLVLGVLMIPLLTQLLDVLSDPPHTSKQTVCALNLRGIGKSLDMYAAVNDDQYPSVLEALIEAHYLPPKMFRSRTDKIDRPCSYFYLAPHKDDPVEVFVACTFKGVDVGVRRVLCFDGVVRQLSEAEFQAELAKPCNAKFAAALKKAEGP